MDTSQVSAPIATLSATVLVITWNGEDYIGPCLNSIVTQLEAGDEVLIVDNGSIDATVPLIRTQFPQARLIVNPRNLGVAVAWNIGLAAATGDIIVFVNQDAELGTDALQVLRTALVDPQVGTVGGKILYPDGRIYHAGGVLSWPEGRGSHTGYQQADSAEFDRRKPVDYITGAVFAVRRATFERVGRFDERFSPAYFEDVDFNLRVRAQGMIALYEPRAVAIHHESTSLGRESEQLYTIWQRSRLRFVLKHYQQFCQWADFLAAEAELLAQPWNPNMGRAMQRFYAGIADLHTLTPAALEDLLERQA